ncbi:MAG: hypothetical protein IJD42_08105 [Clostridia bacterium]|nr:hypothetical protein [Clostridia bacterium]
MILGVVISISVGILCIVLGAINLTGNISLLHSYHRNNVSKENEKSLGRCVGIGMIIIGISLLIYGVLMFISELVALPSLISIALIIMLVGMAVGLVITLIAIKKYNKTIF